MRFLLTSSQCRALRRRKCRYLIILSVAGFLFYHLILMIKPTQLSSIVNKNYECQEQTRFVYIKMIKCASTTLTNVFHRFGYSRQLSFVLPPKDKIYIGWPYQIDDTFYRPLKGKSRFDLLCEHAVYNTTLMDTLMGPGTVYITSIREPFSQFKSMINYYNVLNISEVPIDSRDRFSEYVNHIESYEAKYKVSARLRFCIPDGFSMAKNLMAFNLGFPTGGFLTADKDQADNEELVAKWIGDLDAKFDLVLIVEYFIESLVLLRRMMCWKLQDVVYHSSNSLSYGYRSYNDDHLVNIHRKWSSVDHALYQHFNQTLWRKIAHQGSDFWEEVNHLRRIIGDVETFCDKTEDLGHGDRFAELVVSMTMWNDEFVVDVQYCKLLKDNLLNVLQKNYEQLEPINISEQQPSKQTC